MKSAEELIDLVGKKMVQDSRFGSSELLSFLNDGIKNLALFTSPPDLLVVNENVTVGAGVKYVTLPSNFLGPRLKRAYNSTSKSPVKVHYRFNDFVSRFQESVNGNITETLLKGSRLFFEEISAADTVLTLSYNGKPTVYVDESDDGSLIVHFPEVLAERAICHYAAAMCFDIIEDELENGKKNHASHYAKFVEHIGLINDVFGIENVDGEPELVADHTGISGWKYLNNEL